MKTRHRIALNLVAAAALAVLGAGAQAQLSTATLQGQVSTAKAPAKGGLTVVALNRDTGVSYRTTTRSDGSYVLAGLAPGAYSIRISADGNTVVSEAIALQVGETASLDLLVGENQQVTIVGTISRKDVRNSEIGTSVTRREIESAPQITRNFLSFADLAPGVRFETDASGVVTVRGGAQDRNNINIYIDGVSQKNNILRGGASAMDTTRGNPFPQSAVAEYKVISQNYKAEFDQVSSAAITAVTKSGTNTLHGDVFWDYTKDSFVAYNPNEAKNKAAGSDRAKFTQQQYGFSLGGPIKQDVAHFFLAYEGKEIATPRNVGFASLSNVLPNAGVAATLFGLQGSHTQNFKENMLLGKFDLEATNDHHLDLTVRLRREDDFRAEDVDRSAPGNDKTIKNDETRLDLRHTLTRDQFINEARVGYETYLWSPQSAQGGTDETKYFVSSSDTDAGKQAVVYVGGSPDLQRRQQKGWLFQDDLTYTGMAGHTFKTGAKVKLMEYDLSGTSRSVNINTVLLSHTTGNPIVPLDKAGTALVNGAYLVEPALAATQAVYKNNQFGIYLQDDWKLSKQLELNLGVRWDYESNPLNNSYSTPADLVAALNKLDITRYGITPATGQTYAQSLAKGGININDYINDGTKRKTFYGAIAPRLGFSFDVAGDTRTVVYGGYGRAYDRTMANNALDELQRNLSRGDQFLIRNDYKMPFSDQFALGLRQAVADWNTEVGLNYTHAKNQFNWIPGDRDPNGGFGNRGGSIDPNWGAGPQGYGMLILGDFVTQQKTTQVFLRANKPYTLDTGWTAGVTYTYSDAKTTHRDWNDDIFNWGYGKPGVAGGWNPSKLVERHRVVATGMTDRVLPWGLMLSGKLTVGSGLPYRITVCPNSWDACQSIRGDADWTRQLDVAVAKGFKVPGGELSLRMDVLNVFNTVNWNQFDDWGGGPGNPQNAYGGDNANTGKRTGTSLPMRSVKFSLRYAF